MFTHVTLNDCNSMDEGFDCGFLDAGLPNVDPTLNFNLN